MLKIITIAREIVVNDDYQRLRDYVSTGLPIHLEVNELLDEETGKARPVIIKTDTIIEIQNLSVD